MKRPFPSRRKPFLQTNRSDNLGDFWSSMCLDLQSNIGTLRVSPRLRISTDTSDDADLGLPTAFQFFDGGIFSICGARIFHNQSTPNTVWTEDASAGVVTSYDSNSDLALFDDRLWACRSTELYSKVANGLGTGAWTSRDTISDGGLLTTFQKFPRLYYQFGASAINSIDAANVVADAGSADEYTLTLPYNATIVKMVSTEDYIWIALFAPNFQNRNARILKWDGISAQVTASYELKDASRALSLIVMNDIPYAFDNNGVLSKYTGYSFEEVGRLPFGMYPASTGLARRNGMSVTKNNTILVAVNNKNVFSTASYNENIPSGVWEWSAEFGFVHKSTFSYNKQGSSTITDFGQNIISSIGALYSVNNYKPATSGNNGEVVVGATYLTNAASTDKAIFFDDSNNTVQKKGYFVTTWFYAEEVEDKWVRLWNVYRRLLNATDNIVMKYRLDEVDPVIANITWVNTTSFTVLNSAVDVSLYWSSGIGGEVEILNGTGGASCVHITNAVNNAGTWTVTVDEEVTGVTTGTATARFQHWIKMNPKVPLNQIKSFSEFMFGGDAQEKSAVDTRVQVKMCMTFTGNGEFQKFILTSNPDIKATL